MPVTLRQPLTLEECQTVRQWRNDPAVLPMLRTGHKTEAQQARFYRRVIAPNIWRRLWSAVTFAPVHRYYALDVDGVFIGMGGLTYIQPVAGRAEISLIVDPFLRRLGVGRRAVSALLDEAARLGLSTVTGECYATGNLRFWTSVINERPATVKWEWTL